MWTWNQKSSGTMGKKVKAELKQGTRILFEVEGLGEFESLCQVCDGKYFDSGENRTVLFCVQCKTVFADTRIIPRPPRPSNTLIIDMDYEDGKIVSFPIICNCGFGGFLKAKDGSCLCCGKCLMIVAIPTLRGAWADMKGVSWVV